MANGLVNTPEADDFLTSTQIDSGLRIAVGDPKVDAMVGPDIQAAHIALKEAGKKVLALAKDPTRNDVQRHEAAKKVALEVEQRIEQTRVAIEARAAELRESGLAEAERILGPKPGRSAIESEIRAWVRDQAKRADGGVVNIKKAMAENPDLATVLYSSPNILLGLSVGMTERLKFESMEVHAPAAYAKLSNSVGLGEMAERVKRTARKVHATFYNPQTAALANKRVVL